MNKPHQKGPQASERTKPRKKAPQAPKRSKSAFIFFFGEVSKEMRKTGKMEVMEMSKMASKLWNKLSQDEKNYWKDMARVGSSRFEDEKTLHDGPWTVPAGARALKDPTVPKRPMSPFLAYANELKGMVKHQNPGLGNIAISKLLSNMWRSAAPEVKRPYVEEEAVLREEYKIKMAKWQKEDQDRKRAERQRREELAHQVVAEARRVITQVLDRKKRAPKGPAAPKRPVSPYLAFANERRGMVKLQNPGLDNGAICKLLYSMWSSAAPEVKKSYQDEEVMLREKHKIEMAKWRKENDDRDRVVRQQRKEVAEARARIAQAMRGYGPVRVNRNHTNRMLRRGNITQTQLRQPAQVHLNLPIGTTSELAMAGLNPPQGIAYFLSSAPPAPVFEPVPVVQQIHPHASGIATSHLSMIGPSPSFNGGNPCDEGPGDGFLQSLSLLDEPFQMPQPSSGSCESARGFPQGSVVSEPFQMPQTSGMSDFASGSYDYNMMAWFDNPLHQGVSGTSQMLPASDRAGGAIQDIQMDAAAFELRPLLSVPTQNGEDANSTQGCFVFQEETPEQSRQSDQDPWQM